MKSRVLVMALVAPVSLLMGQEPSRPSRKNEAIPSSLKPVTWERLRNAAEEPQNWLMYSGTLDGQRFSGQLCGMGTLRDGEDDKAVRPIPGGRPRREGGAEVRRGGIRGFDIDAASAAIGEPLADLGELLR